MEINFTLFVQAANFGIAYYLLKYLLFKPALALLEDQERDHQEAQKKLQDHEDALTEKRQAVELQWQSCKKKLKQQMPSNVQSSVSFFSNITPAFNPQVYDTVQHERTQKELEQVIVQRVDRVRA